MENNKYYVYILLDPRHENRPFYVGKGCGDRAKRHLLENAKNKENIRKYRKMNKIREAGLEPIVSYHSTGLTEIDAYNLEVKLIIQYGREKLDPDGILVNLAIDNRPPVRSGPMSAEQKAAIGAGNRGKKRTVEQSAYLGLIRKGKKRKSSAAVAAEKIRIDNIRAEFKRNKETHSRAPFVEVKFVDWLCGRCLWK